MNQREFWSVALCGIVVLAACRPAIGADFASAAEAVQKGDSLFEKRDFAAAISAYTAAIQIDPKNAAAYSGRGRAYAAKGEPDKGIADCTEAIRLNPKLAKAYHGRGIAYRKKRDFDRAIADFTEAIRLDPKYAKAYQGRGLAYQKKGDPDKAAADFKEANRLAPRRSRLVTVPMNPHLRVPYKLMPWLTPICMFILLAAALLHWQRARHWYLVALATGAALVALSMIAERIGEMPLHGRTAAEIASGAVQANESLIGIGVRTLICGVAVAAVGGIGAIYRLIGLNDRASDQPPDTASGDEEFQRF